MKKAASALHKIPGARTFSIRKYNLKLYPYHTLLQQYSERATVSSDKLSYILLWRAHTHCAIVWLAFRFFAIELNDYKTNICTLQPKRICDTHQQRTLECAHRMRADECRRRNGGKNHRKKNTLRNVYFHVSKSLRLHSVRFDLVFFVSFSFSCVTLLTAM